MHGTTWQLLPMELKDDTTFTQVLVDVHREIYKDFFYDDPLSSESLGFHLHAYRRTSGWRVAVILTPWMMSRLLFPEQDPHIVIPQGWSGEERCGTDYQALGPSLRLGWSGHYMQAHLNFHARLGHYLLQPILMNMKNYRTADQALEAWRDAIGTKGKKMMGMLQNCPWQEAFSDRAFLHKDQG
jgi:hypothetical protein